MVEKFNPNQFNSYKELPDEQKPNFKEVDGGFVYNEALSKEDAEIEVEKIKDRIENVEVKNYKEAEKKVEQEEKESDLRKSKNSEALDFPKLGFEKYRNTLAKILFDTKDKKQRRQVLELEKKGGTWYRRSNEVHKFENRFILDIKNANNKNEEIDNLESLKKTKQYLKHLLNIINNDQKEEISYNYMELFYNLKDIREKNPALYSAFVENRIDIADFRHTAFRGITDGQKELKGNENDNEKIDKVLSQLYWGPLFFCSAPSMTWLNEPRETQYPVIFFDNKKVLKKIFENYNIEDIQGRFIDDEIIKEKAIIPNMAIGCEGAKAVRPFREQHPEYESYNDRFRVPRGWKIIFNGPFMIGESGVNGIVSARLHNNREDKLEENFSEERFYSRLKEMTDKKMSLDEIQEQIDKEFMYRADENTTISPLIIDNSFIRAIYLNGKIYNNKGEVIVEKKQKLQIKKNKK